MKRRPPPYGGAVACCCAGAALVDGISTCAASAGLRVVDREPLLGDRVREVDRRPFEVGDRHLIHHEPHAFEITPDVAVQVAVVEVKLIDQPRAAAGLYPDSEEEVVAAFLLEEGFHLIGLRVGEQHFVGRGLRFGLSHCSLRFTRSRAEFLRGGLVLMYVMISTRSIRRLGYLRDQVRASRSPRATKAASVTTAAGGWGLRAGVSITGQDAWIPTLNSWRRLASTPPPTATPGMAC